MGSLRGRLAAALIDRGEGLGLYFGCSHGLISRMEVFVAGFVLKQGKVSPFLLVILQVAVLLASCSTRDAPLAVGREQLFALGYGPAEDQIDLFQVEGSDS